MERLYTLNEAKKLLGATTRPIQRRNKEGKRGAVRAVGDRG
jgi:hypothetical protein